MATTIGSLDLNAFSDLYSDATQYFWFESDSTATYGAGVHITLSPSATFMSNPTGQNILINTDGISIRNGLLPMMTLDNDSLDFNVVDTTNGTYTNVASFGSSSTIGVTDGTQSYLYMDYHSIQAIDKEGNVYFDIHDLRDTEGYAEIQEIFTISSTNRSFNVSLSVNSPSGYSPVISDGTTNYEYTLSGQRFTVSNPPSTTTNVTVTYKTSSENAKAYTLGVRLAGSDIGGLSLAEGNGVTASGMYAHAEGYNTTASGNYSHAEGRNTISSGSWVSLNEMSIGASHAEGYNTTASGAYGSHAEGYNTTASGAYGSHAEGRGTTASDLCAHAEGYNTTASAYGAHAEGYDTTASGAYSHAGGSGTIASAPSSVAFGSETIAAHSDQMVIGHYNKEDVDSEYLFIVGNGSGNHARSNGFAVGWDGQLYGNNNQLDYVIETGSSSLWKWAKYASGKIECWGEKSWSNVDCKTSAGGGYRSSDVSVDLPTDTDGTWLFSDIESCQATMKGSGGSGYTMALRTLCTTTTVSQMFWNTTNATKSTCTVDYYIIGT